MGFAAFPNPLDLSVWIAHTGVILVAPVLIKWKSYCQASKAAPPTPLQCQGERGKVMSTPRALLLAGCQPFSHPSYGTSKETA